MIGKFNDCPVLQITKLLNSAHIFCIAEYITLSVSTLTTPIANYNRQLQWLHAGVLKRTYS